MPSVPTTNGDTRLPLVVSRKTVSANGRQPIVTGMRTACGQPFTTVSLHGDRIMRGRGYRRDHSWRAVSGDLLIPGFEGRPHHGPEGGRPGIDG